MVGWKNIHQVASKIKYYRGSESDSKPGWWWYFVLCDEPDDAISGCESGLVSVCDVMIK
jgi:hypothetical protein